MRIIAYTDGASRGNPGLAGIGIAFYDDTGELIKTFNEYIGETTNNIAEYKALIKALEIGQELKAKEMEVYADSELMVKQLKGEYKVKNEGLKPLYNAAKGLINALDSFKITHVKREFNKEADKLANIAIDSRS